MTTSNQQMIQKPKFGVAMSTTGFKNMVSNTLRDPKTANNFVASIITAVATNPLLQECDNKSILASGLLGASLGLSPSAQLGQFYLVPYKQKEKRDKQGNLLSPACTLAQFQMGYRGYIQLALRSGQYADIDAIEIHEGEYLGRDKFTGKPKFSFIEDDDQLETLPIVGYMSCFEYLNGFRKVIYWSKQKVLDHADRYSPAFSKISYQKLLNGEIPDSEMWKYSSFWYKDFDTMAKKTLLRQLISKWGIMSTEMQTAFERDNSFNDLSDNGEIISTEESEESQEEVEVMNAEDVPNIPDARTSATPPKRTGKVDMSAL